MFPTPWPPNHPNVMCKDKDRVKFFIILFNFLCNYVRLFHHLHECICYNVSCCTLIRIFFVQWTLVLNHLTEKKKKKVGQERCKWIRRKLLFVQLQQEIIRVGSLPKKPPKAWKCIKLLYIFCFYWIKDEKLLPVASLFSVSYEPASSNNYG